jgi:hypothetical protein
MNREDLKRHLVAAIEFEGAEKIGALPCPHPGHDVSEMEGTGWHSYHELMTTLDHACSGCRAAV